MNRFQKVVASTVAGAGILLNVVFPAFAATIEISGNGSDSYNKADVDLNQTTYVQQTNKADIENHINVDASTGGNEANKNTGGGVSVESGDATSKVTVTNTANSNSAEVACCELGDIEVKISGNGEDSKNKVYLDVNQGTQAGTQVSQFNKADIDNDVDADAKTGGNEAEKNTGGSVEVESGDAKVEVTLTNTANANSAKVGGGSGPGGSLSAWILGNGVDSYNKIDVDFDHSLWVDQVNFSDIDNHVDADAKTGHNEAEKNTGGNSSVKSGDATLTVGVDNMANFNWADVDCGGCLLEDLEAKISGNGEDSYNKIEADLGGVLGVDQNNCAPYYLQGEAGSLGGRRHHHGCELENRIYADAKTGDNEVEKNTGTPSGDPSVESGDASGTVTVENSINFNSFGSEAPSWFPEFPELPEMPDVELGFNWGFFWAWLGGFFG